MNEILLRVVNLSISASWLVLAVLLLRAALRRAPKWSAVLLWGVVALRLLCPFSVKSPLSLIPSAETIPLDIEMEAEPAIDTGITAVNRVLNPVVSELFTPDPTASVNPLQLFLPAAGLVWLIGMALLLLYMAVSYFSLRRRVADAVLYRDNAFRSENIAVPFVLGFFAPKIYLPHETQPEAAEHILAHEQTHIRRRDHWWKLLGFLLLTVHWFNPVMWLAYILLCRDIELACDESVIATLDNERRADYTRALVECSAGRRLSFACPPAFGEVGVKERVRSVMNYKKPTLWLIILSIAVCVAAALCFLTEPSGTSLAGWTIDEVSMPAVLREVRSLTVGSNGDFVYCDRQERDRILDAMSKIKIARTPVSRSRDEARCRSYSVTVNDNITLYFADDFSGLWVDNGVKPSYSYRIVNPETAAELFDINNTAESGDFYLTVGAEGVKRIELTLPGSSGGCENADGSLYKKGERIWLEPLSGRTSLWGVTISAFGEDGELIWTASVPATEDNRGFSRLVNDEWVVTNH